MRLCTEASEGLPGSPARTSPRRSRGAWWLVVAIGVAGCHGELFDLPGSEEPVDATMVADMAVVVDLAGAPPPVVTYANIQADLDTLGCSAPGLCHGGAAPMHVALKPADLSALRANYQEVLSRSMAGPSSKLLTKSLMGGEVHAGGQPFANTMNANYVRWLAWITAGAIFDVPDGGK